MRSLTPGRKHAQRTSRSVVALALCASLFSSHSPVVAQEPNSESNQVGNGNTGSSELNIASLIASLSESDSAVANLELEMGSLREAVNRALVDLKDAQARAEQARQGVTSARSALSDTQAKIEEAQKKLDEISRSAYRNGASAPGIAGMSGNGNSEDALARQTYLRTAAQKQQSVIDQLDLLRTEQANEESKLRAARNYAESQESEATEAQRQAQEAIDSNAAQLAEQQQRRDQLVAERDAAQARLDSARGVATSDERASYDSAQEEKKAAEKAAKDAEKRAEEAKKEQERLEKEAEQARAATNSTENTSASASQDSQRSVSAEALRQQQAQRQAEEAAQAAEEAKRKAEQEAENERRAQEAREAALAAASSAAAALVAVSQPDHTTTEDPYINALSSVVDAVANSNGGEAGAVGESAVEAPVAEQQPIAAVQNPEPPAAVDPVLNDLDVVTLETATDVTDAVTEVVSDATSNQQIEIVINRAMSQVGVPYAWGGGDANGPTRGIRDGGVADSHGDYNKVGFDCSGLVLYAFAGAGISLPHFTGYQYQRGTKVSPSEMKRGDLIFYGPNGSNHVAIYLGDGQMIEAPNSGSVVSVVPVRWSGMSEYAVRLL